jgi:hypothetical protein
MRLLIRVYRIWDGMGVRNVAGSIVRLERFRVHARSLRATRGVTGTTAIPAFATDATSLDQKRSTE